MAPAAPMQSPAATPVHRAVAAPDDSAVAKQIEKTHYPNGEEIDAMSILHIAKGILDDCKSTPPTQTSEEGEGEDSAKLTPELQFEVYRLSVQLSHRSLEAGYDVQEKTVTLFNILSSYSWEVKVALILAAFVSSYGEYWLLAQTYRDNDQVAKAMVALLQMSDLLKDDNKKLETLFQPLHKLVNAILDLCYCIVEVKEFFSSAFAPSNMKGFPGFRATVIISCYWVIRSAVICTSYMHSLIVKDPRTTSMDGELDSLARKIQPLRNRLQNQLFKCYQKLDVIDKIEVVGRALRTNHIDNMKVLKLLVDARDDNQTSVFDLFGKKQVSLETFKDKTVLLLISSRDIISQEELPFLQEWYKKCDEVQRSQHAIIFFPITQRPAVQLTEESMKSKKLRVPNFYLVDDLRSIDPAVIRFVKEKLLINFQEGPILVAIGPEGRVVHPNAMPMIWTWGSKAFPLTPQNEESLRNNETSKKLELLINDLDDTLLEMVQEGKKSICLYGGDNLEWIQKFADKAKEVATSLSMTLEMFFLGKSTDSVSKLNKIIPDIYLKKLVSGSPKLSGAKVRLFWAKLERMLLSRAQYLNKTKKQNTSDDDDDDELLRGLGKLLDKSGRQGWAMFSKGNDIALIGDEDVTMKALEEFEKWKGNVAQSGFEGALKDYCEMLEGGPSDHPCCHLHFQHELSDEILENIKCPECHRRLGKYTAFLCHN